MKRYRPILAIVPGLIVLAMFLGFTALLFAGCAAKATRQPVRKGYAVQIDHDTACFEGPRVTE